MDPASRTLLRVTLVDPEGGTEEADRREAYDRVEQLMGRKPELRFAFIQERARFLDDDALDV